MVPVRRGEGDYIYLVEYKSFATVLLILRITHCMLHLHAQRGRAVIVW
jgi:hypothetical protein